MKVPFGRIPRYEEQVYAACLGKVVGVYLGRPFEGWHRSAIEEKWGFVDRYVHEDVDKPLVVADDDISGTLTFVRGLEDSGLYADTPADFFGDTWLNYLMEERTILWWGGRGMSTEHTAYLNLKEGIRAPDSGSIARNGHTVAEQIGAQIFIDAFGMVAPGQPELAADLARRAASVSHDGEAVHAACVVAAMVSAAFVEKRMSQLLDLAVGLIPERSLIARVHRDVRQWARSDRDWRRTWDRIDRKYGYHKYGGNCHVIPNHAVMVMSWAYGPDSFRQCLGICATSGWDTDCNVANVGSVMGLVTGLEGINREYGFQAPFADRLILPTAEGCRGATDVLREAGAIAAMGRRLAGREPAPPPKGGALHHFSLPGALHGYLPDEETFEGRGAARVANGPVPGVRGKRALCIDYCDLKAERTARVSTPVLPSGPGAAYGGAGNIQATPRLYSGMKVTARGVAGRELTGNAEARLYVRNHGPGLDGATACAWGRSRAIERGKPFSLSLKVPDTGGWPVTDLGIEVRRADSTRRGGDTAASGRIYVDSVSLAGQPRIDFPVEVPADGPHPLGWVCDADQVRNHGFSDDVEPVMRLQQNQGRGVMVTGAADWRDYTFESRVYIHLAEGAGLIARYQGLQRYLALIKTRDQLQLVERYYGDTVLDQVRCRWKVDELHSLRLVCRGSKVSAHCDGEKILEGEDRRLRCGGAGYLVDSGLAGFRDTRVR
ncbi:ADP-ribosylglycohydrolase family protein [Candidatus Latescibacterota bacterium]